MTFEEQRDVFIKEVMDILMNPGLKAMTTEELACVIVADIVLPAIEEERDRWVRLTYAKTDNPQ